MSGLMYKIVNKGIGVILREDCKQKHFYVKKNNKKQPLSSKLFDNFIMTETAMRHVLEIMFVVCSRELKHTIYISDLTLVE